MTAKGGNFAAPADQAEAVTPSDVTALEPTRGLFVGGAGNIAVRMAGPDKNTVTFTGVLAGSWLPLIVDRVMATNTTATNIVAVR